MRLFQPTTGVKIRLIVLLMAGVALLAIDRRYDHLGAARDFIAKGIYPLQLAVQVPSQFVATSAEFVQDQLALMRHADTLKHENLRLRARLQRSQSLENENTRLRTLLRSSARLSQKVQISELLGMDMDPFRQRLRIDKGEGNGVFVGQPVLDAHGVMGQVISTSSDAAHVLLISDPSHVIPVEILRNGLRTVAAGIGRADTLQLRYLPDHSDIKVGDELMSSGLGGRFPSDYPVAVVTEIHKIPGAPFLEVYARPRALLDRAREILLVWDEAATTGEFAAADPG